MKNEITENYLSGKVESTCKKSNSNDQSGIVYENIQELSLRTKLPKTWWYSQTRLTGPGSVPRVKRGKYLLFVPCEVDAWLLSGKNS